MMPAAEHEPTTLEVALGYAARGWRVLPITPGKKFPPIQAWQEAATSDPELITAWFTGLYRDHGVGIATGPGSGLWVLDIDDYDAFRDLERANDELPATLTSITGSGGYHMLFTWPDDGRVIRNSAGTRLGAGLDVRGEGGQIVAPPTIHPNGTAYEWDASCDEIADAPGWLLELVCPPDATPDPRPLREVEGDRPGDVWSARTDWAEILTADGWTFHHADRRTGEKHWTRPGKTVREGTSATTGYTGNDNLKVFTASMQAYGLDPEGVYTKLGYLAAVHFGGDHSAAARSLRDRGFVAPTATLAERVSNVEDAGPWPEPTMPATTPDPPPFPLETLPTWAAEHARAVADQVQVPVDLAAMLIIGGLSAACTGRANVHISPNWAEPVNLYLVTAMKSGSGKSAADKLCVDWLKRWQKLRMEAAAPAWEIARQKLRLAEKRLGDMEKRASGSVPGADHEATKALQERNDARDAVPTLPRLLADDATPEAVANLLGHHGERLAIMSTEADLFDMVLKGKPGQRGSFNVYLKAWSGDTLIRDRKGSSEAGPEYTALSRPLMTVAVTVQPSVLARVQGDDEMVSRGFAARFMFSLPPDLMGRRDQRRRFRAEAMPTLDDYEHRCTELANRWASWQLPATLRMTTEAAALLEDFLVEIEPQLADGEDLERLGEWVSKLFASVARYAGLLHLAEGRRSDDPIAAETTTRAVELGRYWLAHAVVVLGMADDEVREQAMVLLTWMATEGRAEFTLAEMQAGIRRPGIGLDKVADYIPAVEHLVEHGWLRPADGNANWRVEVDVRRRGKKSPGFSLWPDCVGRPLSATHPRHPRTASMGERVLSLSSPSVPTDPPSPPLGTRYADDAELSPEPVDNSDGHALAPEVF